ncbi:MAG: hypothetical protein L0287_30405 [Anaerolineae bacterium]|nr:hypothetical protein [Anaerolineae bacterium]
MFVRKFPRQTLLSMLTVALLLASCGGGATPAPTADVNAISTAAVETVMAQLSVQFTQTALAAPSPTSLPTNTPIALPTFALPTAATTSAGALPTVSFNTTPIAGVTQLSSPIAPPAATAPLGDACNNNLFIADLTIPDGTVLKPGEDFKKVWQVRNTGSCTWDEGYALIFIGGDTAIDPVNYEIKIKADFIVPGEDADFDIPLTAPLKEGTYQGTWRMRNDQGAYFGTLLTVVFEVKKP